MNNQKLDVENTTTLVDWQEKINNLVKEKGWTTDLFEKHFLFIEEIGELTKAIRNYQDFHLEVDEQLKNDPDPEVTIPQNWDNLKEEFADVQMYLIDLANHFNIDLTECLRHKYQENLKRQWHD